MKKRNGVIIALILLTTSLSARGMIPNDQEYTVKNVDDDVSNTLAYIPGTWLLTTTWGQHEYYHNKTPTDSSGDHFRLGCWTVAVGQIMNYHQRQSHGFVEYLYQNQDGDYIPCENDLDDSNYIWSHMVDKLDGGSLPLEIDHVSQLLFDTGTVIQKNWGHNNYCLNFTEVEHEIEDHFEGIAIQTEVVDNPPVSHIIDEIDHFRPVYLYIHNTSVPTGHAVVLDGYEWKGREFWVHLNMGWNGGDDGFYHYFDSFGDFDDISLRRVIFIRLSPVLNDINGPSSGEPGILYDFSISAQGFNEPLYFKWRWGDGTYSEWLGRYTSNETCVTSHMWKEKENYEVSVKVKDSQGWESSWSDPLSISLKKSKTFDFSWFQLFFDRLVEWSPLNMLLCKIQESK